MQVTKQGSKIFSPLRRSSRLPVSFQPWFLRSTCTSESNAIVGARGCRVQPPEVPKTAGSAMWMDRRRRQESLWVKKTENPHKKKGKWNMDEAFLFEFTFHQVPRFLRCHFPVKLSPRWGSVEPPSPRLRALERILRFCFNSKDTFLCASSNRWNSPIEWYRGDWMTRILINVLLKRPSVWFSPLILNVQKLCLWCLWFDENVKSTQKEGSVSST